MQIQCMVVALITLLFLLKINFSLLFGLEEGKPLVVWGTGSPRRQFIYSKV